MDINEINTILRDKKKDILEELIMQNECTNYLIKKILKHNKIPLPKLELFIINFIFIYLKKAAGLIYDLPYTASSEDFMR